jgi:two-component system, NarL family, response regulator NreC
MEQSIFLHSTLTEEHKTVKVLIADDQALFLEALQMMLGQFAFIDIIGAAANGREVMDLVVKEKPQVIITDIQMPEMDGVELTETLLGYYPDIKIIGLTGLENDDYVVDMLEAGAKGYLLKTSRKEKLAEAICAVQANGTYFCESTSLKLLQKIVRSKVRVPATEDPSLLTETEKQIVGLICKQLSSKEIADELCIGVKTVEGYRNKIYDKISARNMAGLVVFAVRSGLFKL